MRLVCLSAEAADICARLGAWDDVVAVSAFASQEGLSPRPVIGGFSTADIQRIADFQPDLVLCFSDVQADITAHLLRNGFNVLATNQRTLAEIAAAILLIGSAIGYAPAAEALATRFLDDLAELKSPNHLSLRVYFEEWHDPLISGIGWVGELIELLGATDIFAARRGRASRDRVVEPEEVIAENPDMIVASWCGKRVNLDAIRARPGFDAVRAVKTNHLYALDSDILLQPGPRLLEGALALREIFQSWRPPMPR